jgi:glycosyltransferase involved in cell wall biosynthesis
MAHAAVVEEAPRLMPPRSIVHLSTFLQGGAGRAITDLACAQRRAGDSVLVVSSRTGEAGYGSYPHYLEELTAAGVPVLLEDSLFKRDPAANRRVLDRLLDQKAPDAVDLVHAHAGVPARIGLRYAGGSSRRVAVIQTQHGWGTNKTSEQESEDLATLNAVDHVVVTSEATGALLAARGVPADRMTCIECGLPADPPSPVPADAKAIRAALDGEHRHVIGCIGSITANKNQKLLLHALARSGNDRVSAVFVGEGAEQLAETIHVLKLASRVRTLGYRPDASQWMPAFDLLVVPSLSEGQGLVVLEAFRAGVPVVASDIPALRSLVTDGATGWLFPSGDVGALARAINRALAASLPERARITAAARARFLAEYTVELMVARHEVLYRSVMGSMAGGVSVAR